MAEWAHEAAVAPLRQEVQRLQVGGWVGWVEDAYACTLTARHDMQGKSAEVCVDGKQMWITAGHAQGPYRFPTPKLHGGGSVAIPPALQDRVRELQQQYTGEVAGIEASAQQQVGPVHPLCTSALAAAHAAVLSLQI